MEKTIVGGVFKEQEEVIRAIERLKQLGFKEEDFSVLAKDKDDVEEIKDETDADVSGYDERGTNAGKGAGIGAGTGGVLGGIVGLIAQVGLLTIPGIGVLAAAGPIATTLTGAAIGAGGGGIVGALTGAGIPKEDAEEYEKFVKDGHILLMVDVDEARKRDVQDTFNQSHSINTGVYSAS